MTSGVRLRRAAGVLLGVIGVGTVGYRLIESVSWFDALYMVVITVSTVGYSETIQLSEPGRFFTAALIIVGVGTAFYTATAALELFIEQVSEGGKKARMQRDVDRLSGHQIVCGFGRVGSATWRDMLGHGAKVVVVEADPEKAEMAREQGALVVEGDATHNDVLIEAGIHRAKGIVASVDTDSDNLVVVLSARSMNPDILIVSRAKFVESETKLKLAGADKVVAPQLVGARRMAAMALQPDLADFVDLVIHGHHVEFKVARIVIDEGSSFRLKTLRQSNIRDATGAQVLAIERPDGTVELNPDPLTILSEGDTLVAMGRNDQLEALTALATGSSGQDVDTAATPR